MNFFTSSFSTGYSKACISSSLTSEIVCPPFLSLHRTEVSSEHGVGRQKQRGFPLASAGRGGLFICQPSHPRGPTERGGPQPREAQGEDTVGCHLHPTSPAAASSHSWYKLLKLLLVSLPSPPPAVFSALSPKNNHYLSICEKRKTQPPPTLSTFEKFRFYRIHSQCISYVLQTDVIMGPSNSQIPRKVIFQRGKLIFALAAQCILMRIIRVSSVYE